MKKLEEIKLTTEEAAALMKRLDQKEMTERDKEIIIDVLQWFRGTWWAKYLYKVFIFCIKLEKLLGLQGKTWLSGPLKE